MNYNRPHIVLEEITDYAQEFSIQPGEIVYGVHPHMEKAGIFYVRHMIRGHLMKTTATAKQIRKLTSEEWKVWDILIK